MGFGAALRTWGAGLGVKEQQDFGGLEFNARVPAQDRVLSGGVLPCFWCSGAYARLAGVQEVAGAERREAGRESFQSGLPHCGGSNLLGL